MLSKNQIKLINSLKIKKFRDESNLFLTEGTKIVSEILNSPLTIHSIYAKKTWLDQNNYLLAQRNDLVDSTFEISDKELERISSLSTANEVLMVVAKPSPIFQLETLTGKLTLMLDEVKDPGNLGTIIRIADWFGIENIICSKNSVDVFNPKVIQATMGSVSRINIFYQDLEFVLEGNISKHLSLPVYGALLNGENIYKVKLMKWGIILLGNESKGISNQLLPFITHKIKIPSYGNAESLNVSTAAAVICSEFVRNTNS
ncbi:MAG: RNA methyltransferase [Bacteroidetes bacterium]|nr:RNA methyltransferase [Bacteroidota bacterium]HET6242992.1 RNA methyltransferase [Bacteroidia bacterium]